jgi:hypothetical protein
LCDFGFGASSKGKEQTKITQAEACATQYRNLFLSANARLTGGVASIVFQLIKNKAGYLEARVGFEPTNGGFADLSLRPLGYRAESKKYSETCVRLSGAARDKEKCSRIAISLVQGWH